MPWPEDYLSSLKHRDSAELGATEVYSDYTKLAQRLNALKSCNEEEAGVKDAGISPARNTGHTNTSVPENWKNDLIEAQKRRTELQVDLEASNTEIQRLHTQARADGKRIGDLTLENTALVVKLQDRVEELKGKAKLLEDLHDETLALTLQNNVLEEQNAKLKRENKELIDRWMERKGQEADAMNKASDFS